MKLTEVINDKGSSFHSSTIYATPQELMDLADKNNIPYGDFNDGTDKVNFDFDFQAGDDLQFTVYDWKEYKPLDLNREYRFHIGGVDRQSTEQAKKLLIKLLQ
jgi:hypothetical protein